MDKAKYIVAQIGNDEVMIVFPSFETHNHMARFFNNKVVSAGFIDFFINASEEVEVKCTGKSVSLNLKSRPKDTQLAEQQILPIF